MWHKICVWITFLTFAMLFCLRFMFIFKLFATKRSDDYIWNGSGRKLVWSFFEFDGNIDFSVHFVWPKKKVGVSDDFWRNVDGKCPKKYDFMHQMCFTPPTWCKILNFNQISLKLQSMLTCLMSRIGVEFLLIECCY